MIPYLPNRLKRVLAERKPALGFWLSLNSIAITEMAAGAGWDWLLLDMEHSIHTDEAVEHHVLAARHGGDAELVVRIPSIDPVLVKRLIDGGVRSFMFPYVQTVEEAKLAVAATRYPPQGVRGFSGTTRASHWGRNTNYLQSYADDIFNIIQIETPQAIANIPAFGAIDGVDAMLIGANDLAASMGHLGDTRHPEVVAAFDAAGNAIRATGKASGFQFFDERASKLIGEGFTLAAVAGDIHTVSTGMAEALKRLR
ncbi:MAG TPA: aldolase/citrate lyase family protein [Devosia sp.]|nr:aldolase/citrate lyase family protein [Devosia sp.]